MDSSAEAEDRLLSVPERDMVVQTRPPAVDGLGKAELQALGKRLREARDRSRRIASQLVKLLTADKEVHRAANGLRARHGHGPLLAR